MLWRIDVSRVRRRTALAGFLVCAAALIGTALAVPEEEWETFFGDTMVYGGINAADAWDLIPADLRRRFDRVASGMQRVMTRLDDGADQVVRLPSFAQPAMRRA